MLFESPSIRVERDDQIATLWLDRQDRADNRITISLLDELERALLAVRQSACLDLLVVRSAKSAGFCPGFDLDELSQFRTVEERASFAARGQQITQLLENLSPDVLTVAVLEGECRSAGLDLALACDYRVLLARPDAMLGFPEINLGLIPCWGATQRLPRLIGLGRALRMLEHGEMPRGHEILSWGLVDAMFSEKSFRIDLQAFLDRLQDAPRRLPMPRSFASRLCDGLSLARWIAYGKVNRSLNDVFDKERPAARAILRAVQLGYSSVGEGLAAERTAFVELGKTDTCTHLLNQARRAAQPSRIHPEPINPVAPLPERIGIVGGGVLGSALACDLATRGRQIVLQEANEETLELANQRIETRLQEMIGQGRVSASEAEQTRKNIRRTIRWMGFEEAGFVIEAAEEDLGIKRGIFHELEQHVRPRTILVTAGSTVRVDAIQAELQRPGRVAGLHFLDANQSNLVEVVRAPGTDSGTIATLDAWMRTLGHTPILVSDRPGRLVRRVQLAYWSEAVLLVSEGMPPELIDRQVRRFGMAKGPLEEIDAFSFDSLARLVEEMQLARGDQFAGNLLLERMRAYGWNGCENREGFYRYRRGRARPNSLARVVLWHDLPEDVIGHYVFDPEQALNDGVDRLVMRCINEVAACLAEEHDADPGTVDLALTLGANWAPHRGGPLRYADELGLNVVVERLAEFSERFGKRFEPCLELQRRAEAGESFYGSTVPMEVVPYPVVRKMAG
ncbi:MAG: enoyl-CoA hydratase/isomerase family protein [Planctomycetes bacterium]|nr:enoyl-CoA hydratase/isomerase family protein [Planctomycetota bacterium]